MWLGKGGQEERVQNFATRPSFYGSQGGDGKIIFRCILGKSIVKTKQTLDCANDGICIARGSLY